MSAPTRTRDTVTSVSSAESAPLRIAYALGITALAVLVAVVLLGLTGQLVATPPFDPGALVRVGLPAARAVHDLAAAVAIGCCFVGAFLVPPERSTDGDELLGARLLLARVAAGAAALWLAAGVVVLVLTAADLAGMPLTTPGFSSVLFSVVTQIDLGRAYGVSLVAIALALNLLLLAQRVTQLVAAAVLALLALIPLALVGHSAGSADHMNSVDSLAFHLVGVTLWVGGLVAVLVVAPRLGSRLEPVVRRYSALALVCFVAVAVSGTVNALLRVGGPANLATPYGALVIGKIVALVVLGAFGFWHRQHTIAGIADRPTLFRRIAAVEVAIMAATMGLAVALSRSAPPVPELAVDPRAALLGHPVPPPLTVGSYFTSFYPELGYLVVGLLAAGLYLLGVRTLARRGDKWPVNRTVFWLLGCALLIFLTSGGPGFYGRTGFSLHMVQHMSLMVLVPLPMVFAAPITLALRAVPRRRDGSFGSRELLQRLIHSRVLRLVGHPVVAFIIFLGSLVVFYYTDLFPLAMFTHAGHVLMTAHFIGVGYLFVWSLLGIDPGPARPPYPLRIVLLLMSLGFHAFFGISLMSNASLLAPDWWHSLGYTDDAALLADQQRGGGIAWGAGDLPAFLIGVALVVAWVRSDKAETKRQDRAADRDDDAELKAYNAQLAAMARDKDTR